MYTWSDTRKAAAARKAEAKAAQQAYLNRGAGQEARLGQFQALYDRDKGLKVSYIDLASVETQQFYDAASRAWDAFRVLLVRQGVELNASGIKRFQSYMHNQRTDTEMVDISKPENLAEGFNRLNAIGGFHATDFVKTTTPAAPLTGRDREEQERKQYLADLRTELGEPEFQRRYGNQGSPLGARRPNLQI
jgi:hypothetical protein